MHIFRYYSDIYGYADRIVFMGWERAIAKEREKYTFSKRGRPSALIFVNRLWISGKIKQESEENRNKKVKNKKKTDRMNKRKTKRNTNTPIKKKYINDKKNLAPRNRSTRNLS